jgi:hypothetical protein
MTANPLEIIFHMIWILTEANCSPTTILLPSH